MCTLLCLCIRPVSVHLDYALFRPTASVVEVAGLSYNNLFDVSLAAIYSAMEGVGGSTVHVVVSKSGWLSAGYGDMTTVALAQEYNNGFDTACAAYKWDTKET
ncbi:hypothetical protein AMTRI_Chr01g128040 [Amborella trichopoda]|uniref:Glucan endo-1,3-beta-D-glucosidase n=1 Tax=Amborella trichopoda TaxID=13333 RepID=W1NU85_AMBTC|nr:hypothetical protein AMTR_s00095p00142100 [Amborella trichopoda]